MGNIFINILVINTKVLDNVHVLSLIFVKKKHVSDDHLLVLIAVGKELFVVVVGNAEKLFSSL